MSDVIALARQRHAELLAELRRIEAFLKTAEELLARHEAQGGGTASPSASRAAPAPAPAASGEPAPAPAAAPTSPDGAGGTERLLAADHFLYRPLTAARAEQARPGGARDTASADVLVGRRLRQRRWMMGLTQKQLARMIGVEPRQIQHYEEGRVHISTSRMWYIAGALKVPMSYFFEQPGAQEAAGAASAPVGGSATATPTGPVAASAP